MVKGLMVEKIEGHINGGNAEVRVCMSLVWIVDVCKVLLQYRQFLLSLLLFHLSRRGYHVALAPAVQQQREQKLSV